MGRGGFTDGRSPLLERPSEGRGGAMINQIRHEKSGRGGKGVGEDSLMVEVHP